jgi:hypothetical protein
MLVHVDAFVWGKFGLGQMTLDPDPQRWSVACR